VISVVIPALDEEVALPSTLEALETQRGELEVLVVDGGSLDGTRGVVEAFRPRIGNLRWIAADRGRGLQMNVGADSARGEWLLFLHADTRLPPGAIARIAALPGSIQAGCFRHRFSGRSLPLRLLSWMNNVRWSVTRVAYGDQAVFVRRRLFLELGGFPDRDMEDVAFGLALGRVTKPVRMSDSVITDSRKFEAMGPWRATWRATRLLLRHRLGREVAGDAFFGDFR
jgi:rSAM/selenodomain-associated transferase 2